MCYHPLCYRICGCTSYLWVMESYSRHVFFATSALSISSASMYLIVLPAILFVIQANYTSYYPPRMDIPHLDDPDAFFSEDAMMPPPLQPHSSALDADVPENTPPPPPKPSHTLNPEGTNDYSSMSSEDVARADAQDNNNATDANTAKNTSAGQSVMHFFLACCASPVAYFFPSTEMNVGSMTSYAMLWPQLLSSPSSLFYHTMSLSLVVSYQVLATSLLCVWYCIPASIRPEWETLVSTVKTLAMLLSVLIVLTIIWCMFLGLGFCTYWCIYYLMLPPYPITVPLHFDYSASAAHSYLMNTATIRSQTADQDFSLLFTPSTGHAHGQVPPTLPISSPLAHAAVGPKAFLPLAPIDPRVLATATASPLALAASAASCRTLMSPDTQHTHTHPHAQPPTHSSSSTMQPASSSHATPHDRNTPNYASSDFDAAYLHERSHFTTAHTAAHAPCPSSSLASVAAPHSRPPSTPLLSTATAYDLILHVTTPAHPYFHPISRQYTQGSLHEASVLTAVSVLYVEPPPLHPSLPSPKSPLVPLTTSTWSFAPFAPAHAHATHTHESTASLRSQELYTSPLAFVDDTVLACAAKGCHVDDIPQPSTFARFFAWLMHVVVTSFPARMFQWSTSSAAAAVSVAAAPYHILQMVLKYLSSLFGANQELRTHAIPLFVGVPTASAPVALQVMLTGPHAFDINVVDARVSVVARTSGVQWLMLYWPFTACIVGTCLCAFAEAVIACLIGAYVYIHKEKQWEEEAEQAAKAAALAAGTSTDEDGTSFYGDVPASSPRAGTRSPRPNTGTGARPRSPLSARAYDGPLSARSPSTYTPHSYTQHAFAQHGRAADGAGEEGVSTHDRAPTVVMGSISRAGITPASTQPTHTTQGTESAQGIPLRSPSAYTSLPSYASTASDSSSSFEFEDDDVRGGVRSGATVEATNTLTQRKSNHPAPGTRTGTGPSTSTGTGVGMAAGLKVEGDVLSLGSLVSETPEQCRDRFWERLQAVNPWSSGIKDKVE